MRRDIQKVDDDIVRKKRIIEQALYSDPDIVEVLDDPDIDPSCPEDLLYSSIYPFIRIPGTQDKSKNYITFSISDMGLSPRNEVMKNMSSLLYLSTKTWLRLILVWLGMIAWGI